MEFPRQILHVNLRTMAAPELDLELRSSIWSSDPRRKSIFTRKFKYYGVPLSNFTRKFTYNGAPLCNFAREFTYKIGLGSSIIRKFTYKIVLR